MWMDGDWDPKVFVPLMRALAKHMCPQYAALTSSFWLQLPMDKAVARTTTVSHTSAVACLRELRDYYATTATHLENVPAAGTSKLGSMWHG
jgi:hypothetical protein